MKRREALLSLPGLAYALTQDYKFSNRRTSFSFQKPGKVDVLASLYTWYDATWYDTYRLPFTFPLRAPYHSRNPGVARDQNLEKNHFGIPVDLISWWGPPYKSYEWFKDGYLKASNLESRKFCFLYETYGRLKKHKITHEGKTYTWFDFSDPENEKRFLEDIEYLDKNYFQKYPNCYKVDGRPLLYIWTSNIKNLERVSRKARDKVYLVGNEYILFPPDGSPNISTRIRLQNLGSYDAITGYGVCPVYVAKKYGSLTYQFFIQYVEAVKKWASFLGRRYPDMEIILPLQFAYHDNRGDVDPKDGKNRVLTSTEEQVDTFVRVARYLRDRIPQINRIHLTSYNEHWEGHGAEPSQQYGHTWMRAIKRYMKDNQPYNVPPFLRDLR